MVSSTGVDLFCGKMFKKAWKIVFSSSDLPCRNFGQCVTSRWKKSVKTLKTHNHLGSSNGVLGSLHLAWHTWWCSIRPCVFEVLEATYVFVEVKAPWTCNIYSFAKKNGREQYPLYKEAKRKKNCVSFQTGCGLRWKGVWRLGSLKRLVLWERPVQVTFDFFTGGVTFTHALTDHPGVIAGPGGLVVGGSRKVHPNLKPQQVLQP